MDTRTALFNLRRAIWRSVAIMVVLVVSYVLLGRQLTPMVERTVPTLETYLSDLLEQPVNIASITGEWRGFGPSFTVRNLTIGDSFTLTSLTLEPALLVSLAKQEAIFSRFILNGARVDVVRDDAGWAVPAFAAVGQDEQLQDVFAELYDQLLAQDAIQLRDIALNFISGPHRFEALLTDALIIGTHEYHELSGEVLLDPVGQAVSASLQIEAQNTRTDPLWRAYLRHDTVDTVDLLPGIEDLVAADDFNLRQVSLSAQWWLHWERGEFQSLQAEVQRGGVRYTTPHSNTEQTVTGLSGAFLWQPVWSPQGWSQQAQVRNLSFQYNDQLWPDSSHDLQWGDAGLKLTSDQINIGTAGAMIQPWLPIDIFERHALRGLLLDTQVEVPRSAEQWQWLDGTATGQIREGEFAAWDVIPGFQRVNGAFSASARDGVATLEPGPLDVDLSAFLPGTVPLTVQSGQVAWRVADDYTLKIASGPVSAVWHDSGEVNGRFAFSAGMAPDRNTVAEPVFALSLAGNRLHTDSLRASLPRDLDPAILEWMQANLSQLDSDAWSLVLPNVMAASNPTRIGMMTARVNDLSIRIDDDWPQFDQLQGQFWLDHRGLAAQVGQGSFSGLRLESGDVQLPFVEGTTELTLTGQAVGDGADGWRLVTESPLRETIDADIARWQVAGTVQGPLDLVIPLTEEPAVRLGLDMTIADGDLYMPDLDLRFRDISGPLRVSTRTGLTSRGLQAQWFDESLTVGVNTDVSDPDAWNFYFPASGSVNLAALGEWLGDPWLSEQAFAIPISGEVSARAGEFGLLVRSDLVGLPLEFPAPLGKAAEAERAATLALTVTDQTQSIRGSYGEHVQFNLNSTTDDGLQEGTINVKQTRASEPVRASNRIPSIVPGRMRVNIDLPEIDLASWRRQWEILEPLYLPVVDDAPARQNISLVSEALPIDALTVRADHLHWKNNTVLEDLRLTAGRQTDAWQAEWQSNRVAGELVLPFADGTMGQLVLDYLRLPEPEHTPVAVSDDGSPQRRTRPPYEYSAVDDALANFSSAMMPPLQVTVEALAVGESDYGQWQFDVLPEDDQIRVEQVLGDWRGIRVVGDMIWRTPEGGEHSTQLDLSGEAGNLADVLAVSGLTPVITSRSAAGRALVEWRGSPAAFDLTGLNGNVEFDLRSGSLRELDDFDGIRVIGLLNVTRIFRRLALDFSDVFSAGISYDQIRGDLQLDQGTAYVGDRFFLDGSGAKMFFGGQYDMFADELDAEGVVIARVSNTAGLLALGAGFSPPVALMVIFGERAFERELERLFSVRTRITGSLAQPDVRASRLFDSDIRGNDATIEERMRELFGPDANR